MDDLRVGNTSPDIRVVTDVISVPAPGPPGPPGPEGPEGPIGPAGPVGPSGEGASLPAGGTAGQVLTKASSTDFDASWQTDVESYAPIVHTHVIADTTGLQASLDTKLATSAYTAADILTKLLTVDGVSSGLDADLLDGQSSAHYLAWANFTGVPASFTPSAHNHTIAEVTLLQASLDAKETLGVLAGVNTQTASYTFVLTDKGKAVEMNVASANNLTIPLNASVPFPIGSRVDISQIGAGQTTIVATGGVTIRQRENKLKLAGQYAGASLYKRATDEWLLFGDLSA